MPVEVLLESVFVEVGLEGENFLRDLLVLALDAFQLRFSLVEVQALRFELNMRDRVALAEPATRDRRWCFLSRRDLDQLLQQLLIVSLDLSLLH